MIKDGMVVVKVINNKGKRTASITAVVDKGYFRMEDMESGMLYWSDDGSECTERFPGVNINSYLIPYVA